MDLDDIRPTKKPEITIGEDLALLSVAELEHRVPARRRARLERRRSGAPPV